MEHILDQTNLRSMLARIEELTPASLPLWGKMNVAQMLAHVNQTLLSPAGEVKGKQSLMGKIMSLVAKPMFLNEKPFKQNLPTAPIFVVPAQQDFDKEKQKLLSLLKKITEQKDGLSNRVHVFLGKIDAAEWSRCIYKHVDHHLRQFGV